MDPALLPPIYLAYHDTLSEPTEAFHNNIRERFSRSEEQVVGAMRHFTDLAEGGRDALVAGDTARLSAFIDRLFRVAWNDQQEGGSCRQPAAGALSSAFCLPPTVQILPRPARAES